LSPGAQMLLDSLQEVAARMHAPAATRSRVTS
jgi:hypothetical protein